jgi:hypothetical protein
MAEDTKTVAELLRMWEVCHAHYTVLVADSCLK